MHILQTYNMHFDSWLGLLIGNNIEILRRCFESIIDSYDENTPLQKRNNTTPFTQQPPRGMSDGGFYILKQSANEHQESAGLDHSINLAISRMVSTLNSLGFRISFPKQGSSTFVPNNSLSTTREPIWKWWKRDFEHLQSGGLLIPFQRGFHLWETQSHIFHWAERIFCPTNPPEALRRELSPSLLRGYVASLYSAAWGATGWGVPFLGPREGILLFFAKARWLSNV